MYLFFTENSRQVFYVKGALSKIKHLGLSGHLGRSPSQQAISDRVIPSRSLYPFSVWGRRTARWCHDDMCWALAVGLGVLLDLRRLGAVTPSVSRVTWMCSTGNRITVCLALPRARFLFQDGCCSLFLSMCTSHKASDVWNMILCWSGDEMSSVVTEI